MLTSTFYLRRLLCAGLAGVAVIAASWSANVAAGPGDKKPAAKKSLDDELLDDLSEPAAELPAEKPAEPKRKEALRPDESATGSTKDRDEARGDDLDDALLKGLEEGEDISLGGPQAADNPIARLNERMREVQRRIARAQADEKTQRLEREISDELAKLIEQVERQARKSGQASSSAAGSSRSQAKQPGEGAKPAEQPSDNPARESSDRMRKQKTAKVDNPEYQDLLKDVWGRLPPHLRQQMEQSANEEFLPKYETEISEYFRALNQRGKRK
ncbi:MAG TPA: hypothetical protein VJ783_11450 [Pirellulales bacterium]|nr:hypothetical protein [Pirellulales bacterium]